MFPSGKISTNTTLSTPGNDSNKNVTKRVCFRKVVEKKLREDHTIWHCDKYLPKSLILKCN